MRKVFSVLLLSWLTLPRADAGDQKGRWWSDEVEQALAWAGDNRPELAKALAGVPRDQRKEMSFLLANLSEQDRKSLRAEFLLENVALACKARQQLPWGQKVPDDIFL